MVCALGPSKAPLFVCDRCASSLHFDCLAPPRPIRKPPSGVIDICDACKEELAVQSKAAADAQRSIPPMAPPSSNGNHRGEAEAHRRREAAAEVEAREGEDEDDEEGDEEEVRVLREPPLPSSPRPPLSVRDPASLPSAPASLHSPVYSATGAASPTSLPSFPTPVPRRTSLKGSAGARSSPPQPSPTSAAPSAVPSPSRPRVPPQTREKRPKVTAPSTAAAAASASPVSSPTASASPASVPSAPTTPPSLPSKLSDRLAGVVGGEVGVRFAAEVEAVVRERRLSAKELRDLYTRIVPNLASNAALLSSVRDGRLSASELCSMSNKELADERVQRERQEAAKQSLKDVIAAPEVMIAKQTKAGVEFIAVAGEKVTQTDMFDERITGGTRRGGDAVDAVAAREEEADPWGEAGELPSTKRQQRASALDSPLSPSSDEGDPFRGGGEGWDGVTAEEMDRKYDDEEGERQTEEKAEGKADSDGSSSPSAAGKRLRSEAVEVDAGDDGDVEVVTRSGGLNGVAGKKRRRVEAEVVNVDMEVSPQSAGQVHATPTAAPPSSSASIPSSRPSRPPAPPPPVFIDVEDGAAAAPPASALPTIDLFDSPPTPSPERQPVPAKSPKSPRASAVVPPELPPTPPPSVPTSSPSPESPLSPPMSPTSVSVVESFQPLSASRSASFFGGALHSEVRWSAALVFDHHGVTIPFTGRLVGVSGQSESQEAVRALSSSALPSRVSVTAREPVAAAEELLREIGRSDLRMAALYLLTPATGSAKALDSFCAFHAEKQRVGIADARGPDKVGLFFRFGRLAPIAAAKGQRNEVSADCLRQSFSGVRGIREDRAFFAVVAWLDKRRPPGGERPPTTRGEAKGVASPAASLSTAAATPPPPSAFPAAGYPFPYPAAPPVGFPPPALFAAPPPVPLAAAPLPGPSSAPYAAPLHPLHPSDPRARPPEAPVALYAAGAPPPHPFPYPAYRGSPFPAPAAYGGPSPLPPTTAAPPPPSQASGSSAFDPVLGFLSSIQQPPSSAPLSSFSAGSPFYAATAAPPPRAERLPSSRSPPRDPRAPPPRAEERPRLGARAEQRGGLRRAEGAERPPGRPPLSAGEELRQGGAEGGGEGAGQGRGEGRARGLFPRLGRRLQQRQGEGEGEGPPAGGAAAEAAGARASAGLDGAEVPPTLRAGRCGARAAELGAGEAAPGGEGEGVQQSGGLSAAARCGSSERRLCRQRSPHLRLHPPVAPASAAPLRSAMPGLRA